MLKVNKKIRTTIRLPQALRKEMLSRLVKEGYGLRGKSKWVSEAITNLMSMKQYPEYVSIASGMSALTETEVLLLPKDVMDEVNKGIYFVRTLFPTMEGVQSSIIRSSIIQRLLRT